MPKKKAAKKVSAKAPTASASHASVGRPKGSGKFGCETKVVRVPAHLVDSIYEFVQKKLKADKAK